LCEELRDEEEEPGGGGKKKGKKRILVGVFWTDFGARVWGREGWGEGSINREGGVFLEQSFCPVVGLLFISKQKPKYFITSK
jgi:hypothetical protein